jgi:hypothetical protein
MSSVTARRNFGGARQREIDPENLVFDFELPPLGDAGRGLEVMFPQSQPLVGRTRAAFWNVWNRRPKKLLWPTEKQRNQKVK